MMPVLSVFIDSLMPESVENMEFLSCFENMARVKSELPSYSNTCHASMYTGVYPNKHKHFFIWKYSPETSPFRSLQKLKLHKVFNSTIIKYLLYASICKIKYEIVPYGFLSLARQSIDRWSAFDFKTVKFWGEPDMYVGNYLTIFKILNDANVKYQILWIPKGSLNKVNIESTNTFIYVFIGHIDPVTHLYGQNSVEGRKKLREIDGLIEKFYLNFKKMHEDFYFLVFSDHGQTEIKERIDLYSLFSKNGKDLNDYLHFIDSCYARFWFKNDEEREEIEKVLSKLEDIGVILTNNLLKKYHAEMPREYGDLIFCLKEHFVFDINPKDRFMHGYLPDNTDLDGVCVSNKKIKGPYIKLQDIAPSILQALDIRIPEYMDGEVIWK